MRIGIDFDDVLAPSIIWFRKYLNEKHNKNIEKLYFDEVNKLEMTTDEYYRAWNDFCNTDKHHDMPPLTDSIAVLEKISKKHELYLISARSTNLEDPTSKWISKHFPRLFKELHLINRSRGHTPNKKSDICNKNKIDILIDDSLSNLLDCKNVGTQGIWFTQYLTSKKNEYKDKNIIIARSWLDVERQIEKIEKKGK
jgi:uncharacterized HAD superfamily protein